MSKKRTPEQIKELADYFLTAESDAQVAEHFGMKLENVGQTRRRLGFKCPIIKANIEKWRHNRKGKKVFTDEVVKLIKEVITAYENPTKSKEIG